MPTAQFNEITYNKYIQEQIDQSLLSVEYIMAYSLVDANIDPVKIIPYSLEAQQLRLEPMIGSALLSKLLVGDGGYAYQVLHEKFVMPVLLHQSLAAFLDVSGFSVAEGGVYQHTSSEAQVASSKSVSVMVSNEDSKAKAYGDRLVEFLDINKSRYPEYSQCVADGIKATKMSLFRGGLVIGPELGVNTRPHASIDIPSGVVYGGVYGGQVCRGNSDGSDFFIANVYWGNSEEKDITFDYSTLENEKSDIPNYVYAKPEDNYFWVVSEREVAIGQYGTAIPLDPYANDIPEEAVYVKGVYNGMYYIRIKMAQSYSETVQFTLQLI